MFCITPELYAALKRTGLGPREVRIADRIVIPLEYARWSVEAEPLRVFARRYLFVYGCAAHLATHPGVKRGASRH
jgi:hypothetical protein